jgi:hypothetical protein
MKNNADKIINVATNYLVNIIKESLLNEEVFTGKEITNETRNYYNNLINEFSNDIKNELKNRMEKNEEADFYRNNDFYGTKGIGILDKFHIEKYHDIYRAMPTQINISITDEYVCDGNHKKDYRNLRYEKYYVACSKEYIEEKVDYYKHAKENGYTLLRFGDEKEKQDAWEKLLEKSNGNFYVQEEYKAFFEDDDNIEDFDNFSDDTE